MSFSPLKQAFIEHLLSSQHGGGCYVDPEKQDTISALVKLVIIHCLERLNKNEEFP